jgi:hypothetical protein
MTRRIVCYFLAGLFLASSIILPLGDFSLLRDIPEMYSNYTKITTQEEVGAIDFIGDYLLHGKELFGHNRHDKVPANGNSTQFQHQAASLNVVFSQSATTLLLSTDFHINHSHNNPRFKTTSYRDELFRPPLA